MQEILNLEVPTDYAYAKISSSAMLIDLNISFWTAKKLDKDVSDGVDVAHAT